jgi:hypothetical protein
MTKAEKKALIENHEQEAADHVALGKAMSDSAASHSELASHFEVLDPSAAKLHSDLSACCKAMAVSHAEAGARHLECAKTAGEMPTQELAPSTDKAAANGDDISRLVKSVDELLGKLQPTNVRTVPSTDARRPTLVARPGADPNLAQVDERLRHLIHDSSVA